MPGIVALVAAISTDVVDALSAASYPSLTDGQILLGDQHVYEQSSPPRIIFTPVSSAFGPPNPASAWTSDSASERARMVQQAPIASEDVMFEVRCWGASGDSADLAYDTTQALYHQVIISTDRLARGVFAVGAGQWTDATHLSRHGREFVFQLSLSTPVLGKLLQYAPSNVAPSITDHLTLPDGTTGPGCES